MKEWACTNDIEKDNDQFDSAVIDESDFDVKATIDHTVSSKMLYMDQLHGTWRIQCENISALYLLLLLVSQHR